MADLNEAYAALQKADAAGDTDGAKQLADYIRTQSADTPPPAQAAAPPEESGGALSYLGNLAAAGPETVARAGSSLLAAPVAGIAGLGTMAGRALGLTDREPADVVNATQQALTYEPKTQGGQYGAQALAYPFQKLAQGADYAGQKVSDLTGSPLAGTVLNTAIQGLPLLAGARSGAAEGSGADLLPDLANQPLTAGQRMRAAGVDLTPGQVRPQGLMNSMEQSLLRVPVLGEIIGGARHGAQADFQRVAIEKAAAPGASITAGRPSDMLSQAYESFQPLYDQAKGHPVDPTPLTNAFTAAATDRGVQATKSVRDSTSDWLDNQLTSLQRDASGQVDSGQLLKLRSDIRTQIRRNRLSGSDEKMDSAQLMGGAERAITDALNSQLPADALTALRAADAQYGSYKILENAVAKSKDNPTGFTPENLSQSIKEATDKGSYARGGGRLRQFSMDAKETLAPTVPQTGALLPAIGAAAWGAVAHPLVAIPAGLGALGFTATKMGRSLASDGFGPSTPLSLPRGSAGLPLASQQATNNQYLGVLENYGLPSAGY